MIILNVYGRQMFFFLRIDHFPSKFNSDSIDSKFSGKMDLVMRLLTIIKSKTDDKVVTLTLLKTFF